MLDATDFLRPALWVARVLWWLGWDFMIRAVGWAIGWPIWRALTLGYFPDTGFRDLEGTSFWVGLLVELTGLAALAALIGWLSQRVSMW